MRVMFSLASLVGIVALTACQSSPTGLSDADKTAIRSASQKYVEAANIQNVDAWLQQVSENAVFMPLNHAPLEGRKAIAQWFSAPQSQGPVTLSLTLAEIDGRGDVAFVRGAYLLTRNNANVGTGNFIEVWQKESDGAWRIIRDVWNTNAEVATTAGRDVEAVKGAVATHWAAINKGDSETIGRQHTSDFSMFLADMPTRLGNITENSPGYKRFATAKTDWKVRDGQVQPFG